MNFTHKSMKPTWLIQILQSVQGQLWGCHLFILLLMYLILLKRWFSFGNRFQISARKFASDSLPVQKQLPRDVPRKRYSENMQQNYKRTPIPKCDFNKVVLQLIEITLRHACSPINFLHIFRTPFLKNTSGWLLLYSMWICAPKMITTL